jgi:hypothetical protein
MTWMVTLRRNGNERTVTMDSLGYEILELVEFNVRATVSNWAIPSSQPGIFTRVYRLSAVTPDRHAVADYVGLRRPHPLWTKYGGVQT